MLASVHSSNREPLPEGRYPADSRAARAVETELTRELHRRSRWTVAVLSIALLSGCASLSPRRDPLCSEVATFANSVDDNDAHTVELLTDWGGVFSPEQDVVFEKRCQHDQDAASKRLCGYLLENTSTEFATVNFRRALSCLGKSESYLGPPDAQVEYLNGMITSQSVPGMLPDRRVSVEFSMGSNERPPSLKISAQRNKQSPD